MTASSFLATKNYQGNLSTRYPMDSGDSFGVFHASSGTVNYKHHSFVLNTGAKIPAVGIGTWHVKPENTAAMVKHALQAGYRHVDTSLAYGNEKEVGSGIRQSGIPREEIWVTTKIDHRWHHKVPEAINTSLRNLGLDHIELYLMHWPCSTDPNNTKIHLPDWNFIKTWEEMQKLPATGKVKNIGICNVQLVNLHKLLSHPTCKTIPAINQIELHPNNPSAKLIEVCNAKGIHVTAYSVLGSQNSPLLAGKNEAVNDIARKKGKSIAQILLMWGLQRGTSVLPRSITPQRIESNFELDGWSLDDADMAKINAIKERIKVCGDGFLPIRVFFDDDEEYPTGEIDDRMPLLIDE